MRLFDIIKKPIVTEKTSAQELKNGTYVLEVYADATKIDIKKAILDIYGTLVSSVRVINTREKFKQGKKGIVMRKRSSRKAYVTLKDTKTKIDFSIIKF
ncbi:MAG: 50S ribosomal protein L23 [Candidatus Gracilibacteria bacterium]|nr:50S ribosomal protein L23 [Candidatus Gracilibacteria bacterium]